MLKQPIKRAVVVDTLTFSVYGPFDAHYAGDYANKLTKNTRAQHVAQHIIDPVSLKNEGVVDAHDHALTNALNYKLLGHLKAIVTVHDTLSEQGRGAASHTFDELIDQARATILAAGAE